MAVRDAPFEQDEGCSLKAALRRAYRPLSAAVRSVSPFVGAALLRSSFVRPLMNEAYEKGDARFRHIFAALFSGASVRQPFEWQCNWGPRVLKMPVIPAHPRSWNAALVWHWEGYATIRRLYESYAYRFPGGVFFDIGANDGTHTYPLAVRGYRCVSFEPQDSCANYIRLVASANALENITVVRALVTDEQVAEAEFWTSESTWYSSRIREQTERFETAVSDRAPCISIDDYSRQEGVVPTLLKIDVEGWEGHVLRSGINVITHHRPDLLIEIAAGSSEKKEMWELLRGQGYHCVRVGHGHGASSTEVLSAEVFAESHGTFNDDFFFSTRPPQFLLA